MDTTSYENAQRFAGMLPKDVPLHILDVGSLDVNGTLRPIFGNGKWTYTGADVRTGNNVDLVLADDLNWRDQISDESYDVVVTASTLEHCRNPFVVVSEMARALKREGTLYVSVPHTWEFHDEPHDYWRILPMGLDLLFKGAGLDTAEVWCVRSQIGEFGCFRGETYGFARKP